MEEVMKLVKELTMLAITARTYINLRAVKEGLVAPQLEAAAAAGEKTDKPARTKKSEKPAPEKVEEAPAAPKTVAAALGADKKPEVPAMSEKESLDAAFKLGTAFVQKDGKDKVEANKAVLRDHLEKTYKSRNLSGLSHIQRVEVVEWLKQNSEPAGTPVDALS